jgi:hypothetical protein
VKEMVEGYERLDLEVLGGDGPCFSEKPTTNHCVVVEIHKFLEEDNDTLHMYILQC